MKLDSHVEYDKLFKDIIKIIKTHVKVENAQLQKCLEVFNQ